MLLFFATVLSLVIIVWLIRRDRQYLKKNLKEVVGEDMKKLLNLPHDKATFNQNLAETRNKGVKSLLFTSRSKK